MPRSITVATPSETSGELIDRLLSVDGVISVSHQPQASIKPAGDVLTIVVVNQTTRTVLNLLAETNVLSEGSIRMNSLTNVVSHGHQADVDQESDETIWDEMAFMLRSDTNLSMNYLFAMALAGGIAAAGLWTDTLHIVIGAMLIAPAFEPLARLPFGLVAGVRELVPTGIRSLLVGNLMMVLGAALATLILEQWNPGAPHAFMQNHWVSFWSTITFSAIVTSTLGGAAGAIVIGGQKSVLTTGVMVTLALIPSMSLVGMGLVAGDGALMGKAALRWLVDAFLVILMCAVIFGLKRQFLHKGRGATSDK